MSYYLPVEVLEHIVSHLDPMQPTRSHRGPAWRGDAQARKALNALSVASRTCCRIAEPYLYSSIDIDGSLESFGSLELLLQTLLRRRELALHVRRIRVGDFVPDPADPGGKSRLIFVNLNGGETLTPIALWDEVPKIVLDRRSYNDLLRDKGHFPAIKFLDGTYTLGARHGCKDYRIPHPRRFSAVKDVYATCDHYFSEHVGKLLSDSNYSTLDEIAIELLSHLRAQYLDENGSIDPHRYITIPELHSKIVQAHWQKEATGRSRLRDFSSQHGWIPAIHEAGMITIRRKKNPS
ncbi:uncharacterized protein MYCFIDRAFT_84951 [Pseudocercospora fijiensis CIRAD86]|uniref:F-box domain-containing protein n=1 Tax=Pseudocercospora fijiensis (strain CIRAD86) TaxID=383855 RepID=N1Q797_PSEFD|nr:uncharacterized protein MYCFIDRAFT_84951 [Pseudocercospora fijiensis CIRAD86]EME88504.1 hypothetical protein MYCFIDRAFT_84951 [Pseudocercospora fijiensis CIRAD86]